MILTVLEDATEVTQAVAEGAPIPILQLFVQHLCPPVKVKKKKKKNVQIHSELEICSGQLCFHYKLTGKARWWSVKSRTHSTLFNPNPLMLSRYSLHI